MEISQSSKLYLKQGAYIIDRQNPELCLGKGSFGKVYKGYDTLNNRVVAIKQINIEFLEQFDQEIKEVILNEINVMRKFSKKMNELPCQYLVKLFDCFRSDKFVYIVMEFCHHGTLFDQLNIKKIFNQNEVIIIVKQLVEALAYLQTMRIAHRDLKPQNIFVSQTQENLSNQTKIYKIGDFGFSAQKNTFNDVLGTYQYMAPQIFKRQQYTTNVDVWSLGITLHQLLFNELYYSGKNKWEIQQSINQKNYQLTKQQQSKISSKMRNFLELCLTKNKFQRPLASELMNHDIFKNQEQDRSVFKLLKTVIEKCEKLKKMAVQFDEYERTNKRNTIFIQLYLLKIAYCQMNRIAYSISNKQNYISLPEQKFQELIDSNNFSSYQNLNSLSQKVWSESAHLFSLKYQKFEDQYLGKFKPDDQEMIKKVINNEPYEDPNFDLFVAELKKWLNVFKSSRINEEFVLLRNQCETIVRSYQQSS